jgi:hypothetical protein
MNERHLTARDDAGLLGRLAQLERYELDLRERLGARRAQLGYPSSPISDPIYQRLFFTLAHIEEQRMDAERELAQGRVDSVAD